MRKKSFLCWMSIGWELLNSSVRLVLHTVLYMDNFFTLFDKENLSFDIKTIGNNYKVIPY